MRERASRLRENLSDISRQLREQDAVWERRRREREERRQRLEDELNSEEKAYQSASAHSERRPQRSYSTRSSSYRDNALHAMNYEADRAARSSMISGVPLSSHGPDASPPSIPSEPRSLNTDISALSSSHSTSTSSSSSSVGAVSARTEQLRELRRQRREQINEELRRAEEVLRDARVSSIRRGTEISRNYRRQREERETLSSSASISTSADSDTLMQSATSISSSNRGGLGEEVDPAKLIDERANRIDAMREALTAMAELNRRYHARAMPFQSDDLSGSPPWSTPSDAEREEHGHMQYCPILCQETRSWVRTPCGHVFDEDCMREWISQPESPYSCPLCRLPFKTFDKNSQHTCTSALILSYVNVLGEQYANIWKSDRISIICRFWNDFNHFDLRRLARRFTASQDVPNISLELRGLLETSIASYCQNLQKAVHDIVLRDVKYNLRAQLPACFQGQLDRDITAFALTRLVPEFYVKWWRSTYLNFLLNAIDEVFLKALPELSS